MMNSEDRVTAGTNFIKALTKLSFPFAAPLTEDFSPQHCTLGFTEKASHYPIFLWCYLERGANGSRNWFKPASLSEQRVKDLPRAVWRLSQRFSFDGARPRTVKSDMQCTAKMLSWLDGSAQGRRYERIFSDPDLALEALQRWHTHLRQCTQIGDATQRISLATASTYDALCIKVLSIIHEREFRNAIEPIKFVNGDGVKAPAAADVAVFSAIMQGVFDSVVRLAPSFGQQDESKACLWSLTWQQSGQEVSVELSDDTPEWRLLELGCLAFAALCIVDSGANLSLIQAYEEPDNLQEQLESPDRINLHHRGIKFRAGGQEVPVHLTATTVTRINAYLGLREALRRTVGGPDVAEMFIQCRFEDTGRCRWGTPSFVTALADDFTPQLRRKFAVLGISVGSLTMQQLRTFKDGQVTRGHSPTEAAAMMGHTVATAIRRYCKVTDAESRSEIAPFLKSLTSVVIARSKDDGRERRDSGALTSIPIGKCAGHGHPQALANTPLVEPDCKKAEGCFFCDKFHVHADEEDCVKLLSCRMVLDRVVPRRGDAGASARIYTAVTDRIGAVLVEIKRVSPSTYEQACKLVFAEGKLSRYWASKLQQLHLLGLLVRHPP